MSKMKKFFTAVGYTLRFSLLVLGMLAFYTSVFMAPTLDQDALGTPEIRAAMWNLSWIFLSLGSLALVLYRTFFA